ncbi:MAG: HAMP domain-containing protein [Candidatus Marinimicrobia bacterium]|nr:HAMP domain-containing protein [Candidatus Neomarinimicrobiota bacterium]
MRLNWSLQKKILGGYSLVLILLIAVLTWAFINLNELGKASDAILSENYKSILAAENMIDAIERQDSAILLIMTGYQQEGNAQFQQNISHFLQWFARANDNITIAGESIIIAEIDSGYNQYLSRFSELNNLFSLKNPEAPEFYHETVLPLFSNVRNACIDLREMNQQTMFKASQRAKAIARRALFSMTIIGISALGIGLIFSMILSHLIVKPLQQMIQATKQVAKGNYDVNVPAPSTDELGQLGQSFNTMVRQVKSFHDLNIRQIFSEKKKSDAILRSIDDGLFVVDNEYKIVNMNPAAQQIINRNMDDVIGSHFLEILKRDEIFTSIKTTMETGKAPEIDYLKDLISIKKDDAISHYQYSILPVWERENQLTGVVLLLKNVTRLKELEKLKSEFIMAASHELRTPLTSMGMSISLLIEKISNKISASEKELLMAADEEQRRLKSLVDELLDLSKIEAGKMLMEYEFVQLESLFQRTQKVMMNQAREKDVQLSVEPLMKKIEVKVDPTKITWVLTNLIGNALRYTDAGGVIKLNAGIYSEIVYVSVEDSGMGIPPEYQAKIFDKFVQVKNERSTGGTGLGLAICKEIVRAHGGTIWVDSEPGKGSKFTFTIPLAHPNKE